MVKVKALKDISKFTKKKGAHGSSKDDFQSWSQNLHLEDTNPHKYKIIVMTGILVKASNSMAAQDITGTF